jgi:hypothetical protein
MHYEYVLPRYHVGDIFLCALGHVPEDSSVLEEICCSMSLITCYS